MWRKEKIYVYEYVCAHIKKEKRKRKKRKKKEKREKRKEKREKSKAMQEGYNEG
jgi:hypothetical protein